MTDLKLRFIKTINVFILGNIFFFIGVYVSKLYKKISKKSTIMKKQRLKILYNFLWKLV